MCPAVSAGFRHHAALLGHPPTVSLHTPRPTLLARRLPALSRRFLALAQGSEVGESTEVLPFSSGLAEAATAEDARGQLRAAVVMPQMYWREEAQPPSRAVGSTSSVENGGWRLQPRGRKGQLPDLRLIALSLVPPKWPPSIPLLAFWFF